MSSFWKKLRKAWKAWWRPPQAAPAASTRVVKVKGQPVRLFWGTRIHAQIAASPRPPSPSELQRARQAQHRLAESGAELRVTLSGVSAYWTPPFEVEELLPELVAALPLCAGVSWTRSYEVDRGTLETLGVGLERPVSSLDFGLVLWVDGNYLPRGVELELRGGQLHARWTGPLVEQEPTLQKLEELARQMAQPAAQPWRRVDACLRYGRTDRERLVRFALGEPGPLHDRVLETLMTHGDSEQVWEAVRTYGRFDDWLRFACDPKRKMQARLSAAEHLMLGRMEERCRAAPRLFETPELRQEACVLLEGLVGPEVEATWLSLGALTQEPELLRQIVTGLADTGTARAMPWLYTLREGLGPLQFQLRERVDTAMRDIRERTGAVSGGLALANAPGALSVAQGPGQLSQTREGEP